MLIAVDQIGITDHFPVAERNGFDVIYGDGLPGAVVDNLGIDVTLVVGEVLQRVLIAVTFQIKHVIAVTTVHRGVTVDVTVQGQAVVTGAHIEVVTLAGIAVDRHRVIAVPHIEVFIHVEVAIDNEVVVTAGATADTHWAIVDQVVLHTWTELP